MLSPLQQSLAEFKSKMDQTHKADIEGRATLVEQLKQLKELNQTMSHEAKSLTQALKGDKKLQGNWGEMILEKMLESSGLRLGIEYEREKSLHSDTNKRLRPDVIINLPDNKHIIIDSKVSLNAYEAALNSEDEKLRQEHIKSHLVSLQKHVEALSTKRYDHIETLNAPDFVLMFIPIEGAYLMAIEQNPALFESAFEKNIAVVTPTTLFTTLKTIEQLWRYERHSEHTSSLIKKAADVHDKFVGFIDTFEKVGKQLGLAMASYDKARNQMVEGNGNLIRQAQMLKELAGKTKKELPNHLLDEAEGDPLLGSTQE
uniref:DNA recombination protein RmuC n=1 Tax=Hydrogenovibrio kuenenii TaxID=63658 RepID=UPI00389950D8